VQRALHDKRSAGSLWDFYVPIVSNPFNLSCEEEISETLLGFLLPLLIYLLINFIFESILYVSESLQVGELGREELTLRNIALGINDLKVVLTILSLVIWIFIWKKLRWMMKMRELSKST